MIRCLYDAVIPEARCEAPATHAVLVSWRGGVWDVIEGDDTTETRMPAYCAVHAQIIADGLTRSAARAAALPRHSVRQSLYTQRRSNGTSQKA